MVFVLADLRPAIVVTTVMLAASCYNGCGCMSPYIHGCELRVDPGKICKQYQTLYQQRWPLRQQPVSGPKVHCDSLTFEYGVGAQPEKDEPSNIIEVTNCAPWQATNHRNCCMHSGTVWSLMSGYSSEANSTSSCIAECSCLKQPPTQMVFMNVGTSAATPSASTF